MCREFLASLLIARKNFNRFRIFYAMTFAQLVSFYTSFKQLKMNLIFFIIATLSPLSQYFCLKKMGQIIVCGKDLIPIWFYFLQIIFEWFKRNYNIRIYLSAWSLNFNLFPSKEPFLIIFQTIGLNFNKETGV